MQMWYSVESQRCIILWNTVEITEWWELAYSMQFHIFVMMDQQHSLREAEWHIYVAVHYPIIGSDYIRQADVQIIATFA